MTAIAFLERFLPTNSANSIRAPLQYRTPAGVKANLLRFEYRMTRLRDARRAKLTFDIETNGFTLASFRSQVRDFTDEQVIKTVYYAETMDLVRELSAAARLHVFYHRISGGSQSADTKQKPRGYVSCAHAATSPRDLLDIHLPDEADELLERRVAIFNVWKPIGAPNEIWSQVVCDAATVDPDDMISWWRDSIEFYQLVQNRRQRWYYFPERVETEALVLKTCDTATDGRARYTFQGVVKPPKIRAEAPQYPTIEVRMFAFY